MGYSENSAHVLATFFKTSGKYYTEEMLDMTGLWFSTCGNLARGEEFACNYGRHKKGLALHDAIAAAWVSKREEGTDRIRLTEMVIVVLEPYHENGHPIAMRLSPNGLSLPAWRNL